MIQLKNLLTIYFLAHEKLGPWSHLCSKIGGKETRYISVSIQSSFAELFCS